MKKVLMKKVLIVCIISKYSKYPLTKTWIAYLSAEKLAQLLNCEVIDYRCGYGDPSAYWVEIIQMIIDLQIDAIIVPDLASLAIHIADGAELLPKLKALGVELYCDELGCDNLLATKNFDKKILSLIHCAETSAKADIEEADK